LTSKYQATIPKEVRNALHLKAKDQIIYEILENDTVIIRRASALDIEYLNALKHTLSEWDSAADEKAYKNL
jgi:antitoxin PrlF